jgi:uncharacterized LabA/DUF88 family protein
MPPPQRRSRGKQQKFKQTKETFRTGKAPPHAGLANNLVHIFVDDQNLFYGIVNNELGKAFRVDFGRLLLEVCKNTVGEARAVGSAYIAGVIPDDDSFWDIAQNRGFTVRRGYLGSRKRSKQDDAFLITDLMTTLYEQSGPSTVILVAGDADYMPPLMRIIEKGWRTEVAFISRGVSITLEPYVHEFRTLTAQSFQHFRD